MIFLWINHLYVAETDQPRSAQELGVDNPKLQNIVATVDLDCGKLDLKESSIFFFGKFP